MILDNYWKFLQATQQGSSSTTYAPNTGVRRLDGNATWILSTISPANQQQALYCFNNKATKDNTGIRVGSGSTAPEGTDYCLESDLTSSITNVVNSHTLTVEDGKLKTTYTMSASNNTTSTITISEVGIYKNYYDDTNSLKTCLFARKLLDTPIEVPAYSGFVINFVWEEN